LFFEEWPKLFVAKTLRKLAKKSLLPIEIYEQKFCHLTKWPSLLLASLECRPSLNRPKSATSRGSYRLLGLKSEEATQLKDFDLKNAFEINNNY